MVGECGKSLRRRFHDTQSAGAPRNERGSALLVDLHMRACWARKTGNRPKLHFLRTSGILCDGEFSGRCSSPSGIWGLPFFVRVAGYTR